MAYEIRYGGSPVYCGVRQKNKRKKILICAVALLLVVIVTILPSVRKSIFNYLIPGNSEITKRAFDGLVDSLQNGVHIKDAFFAFCQEILQYA